MKKTIKMLLKKYVKNRRKIKILLFFTILCLIGITLVAILNSTPTATHHLVTNGHLHNSIVDGGYIRDAYGVVSKLEKDNIERAPYEVLKSPKENGIIVPEKYDEHKIKSRIIQDKIAMLKDRGSSGKEQQRPESISDEEHTILETVTNSIQIFYSAPVPWYKTKKSTSKLPVKEVLNEETYNNETIVMPTTPKPLRTLNIAFYPSLGLYKPTKGLLQRHFTNIKNCGIGVLILSLTNKQGEEEIYNQILDLAPDYNLSVTFEISFAGNQSIEYLKHQLGVIRKYSEAKSFYHVYSLSRNRSLPFIYLSNVYKLVETSAEHAFCNGYTENVRNIFDAYFIGHIRLKNHADNIRRLCLEGFYTRLPSNGATYASTWKNWSYLKSFALTYKMLFVPTVGPGFAERNKFPRHGDIQRHRSNGRYYGVAWRTAILNHVGFINIASYNNWPDGSQIEEVVSKAGFLDYNPGFRTKYLDLTAHWVGNFLKNRIETVSAANCYELLNNTIC